MKRLPGLNIANDIYSKVLVANKNTAKFIKSFKVLA